MFHLLGQHFLRYRNFHSMLERVDHSPGEGGNAAVDIDNGFLHALFILKLQIFIFELHRDIG